MPWKTHKMTPLLLHTAGGTVSAPSAANPATVAVRRAPRVLRDGTLTSSTLTKSHGLSNILQRDPSGVLVARRVVSPVKLSTLVPRSNDAAFAAQAHKVMIGLGTLHAERDGIVLPGAGGYLIYLGGAWLVDGNGKAHKALPLEPIDSFTPYAVMGMFAPQHQFMAHNFTLPQPIRKSTIAVESVVSQVAVLQRRPEAGQTMFEFDPSKPYAVKILCESANLRLSCTSAPQKIGMSLVSLSQEFDVEDESFTLVGIHIPKKDAVLPEEAGWRFHALRSIPGMDCKGSEAPIDGGFVLGGDLTGITSIEICAFDECLEIFRDDEETAGAGFPYKREATQEPVRRTDTPTLSTRDTAPTRTSSTTGQEPPARSRRKKTKEPPVDDSMKLPPLVSLEDILKGIKSSPAKAIVVAETFGHKAAALIVANYIGKWLEGREATDVTHWLDLASGRVPFIPLVTFGLVRARRFNFGVLDQDRRELSELSEISFPRNVKEKRFINGDATEMPAVQRLAASLEAPQNLVDVVSTGMTLSTLSSEKIHSLAASLHQRLKPGGLWVIHDELTSSQHEEVLTILKNSGFVVEEFPLNKTIPGKWQGVLIAKRPK